MIQINEMRLNVWVQLADQKVIKREHVGDKVQLTTPIKLTEAITLPEYYDPIPLSPEILLALGFETDKRGWKQKESFFLEIREHGQWVNGKPIVPINYMVYKGGVGAIREVKYLHELQNIWFFIMETELSYTPLQVES